MLDSLRRLWLFMAFAIAMFRKSQQSERKYGWRGSWTASSMDDVMGSYERHCQKAIERAYTLRDIADLGVLAAFMYDKRRKQGWKL